MDFIIVHLADG